MLSATSELQNYVHLYQENTRIITITLENDKYALILEVIQDYILNLNHNPSYTQVKDSDKKIYQKYAKSLKKLFNKLTKTETFEVRK